MGHNIHLQKVRRGGGKHFIQMRFAVKKKLMKPKTWKKWVLYPSPSKEPNSVTREDVDANKVLN